MLYRVPYKSEGFVIVDSESPIEAMEDANLSINEDIKSYLINIKLETPELVLDNEPRV